MSPVQAMRVVGICGSLRKDSFNRKLLKVIMVKLKEKGVRGSA